MASQELKTTTKIKLPRKRKNKNHGPKQTPHKHHKTSTTKTKTRRSVMRAPLASYARHQTMRTASPTPPKPLGPKQKRGEECRRTKATSKKSLSYVFSWFFGSFHFLTTLKSSKT